MVIPEISPVKKVPVISLLGLSGAGKSTAASTVEARLLKDGIKTTILKKDTAIKHLGGRGNSPAQNGIRYARGSSQESRLHGLMNEWLHDALTQSDLILLEGGTRTEHARRATMTGTEASAALTIIRFDVSALTIMKRLHERRQTDERADDMLIIMASKLIGQTYKDFFNRSQQFSDANYFVIDANRPAEEVADSVETIARQQLQ